MRHGHPVAYLNSRKLQDMINLSLTEKTQKNKCALDKLGKVYQEKKIGYNNGVSNTKLVQRRHKNVIMLTRFNSAEKYLIKYCI